MVRFTICSAAVILVLGMTTQPVAAGICLNADNCTLTLDETNSSFSSNGIAQSGNFGTVNLTLDPTTHVVTVDVDLASGFQIIDTGAAAGSFGFDSLGSGGVGGGLTIGNFSSSLYSGAVSATTNDQHFAAFGYANNAAGTSGPKASKGLQEVSFTVRSGNSITDVNQLLNPFVPGTNGTVFFVVDAFDSNSGGFLGGRTGLLAVTGTTVVPEPRGLAFLLLALLSPAGWFVYRRQSASAE